MNLVKILIVGVFLYVAIRLVIIIGGAVLDVSGMMLPSSGTKDEQINKSLHDAGEWFHEHSGQTDAEREKSMNAAGLYKNPETGKYEEDSERFSRDMDEKFGRIGE